MPQNVYKCCEPRSPYLFFNLTFHPNTMNESQNNTMTVSKIQSLPEAQNYIQPLFDDGNQDNTSHKLMSDIIYWSRVRLWS